VLQESAAEYVLLAPSRTTPSRFFQEAAKTALGTSSADVLVFTSLGPDGSPTATLLDCPNLVARGAEVRIPPVAVRRQKALGYLRAQSHDQDWPIGTLILSMIINDCATHVVNLPLHSKTEYEPHRYPLYHYLANILAQTKRNAMPQISAYVEPSERPVGRPFVDEEAMRPRPLVEVTPTTIVRSSGLLVQRISLSESHTKSETFSVKAHLEGLSDPDGEQELLNCLITCDLEQISVRFGDPTGQSTFFAAPHGPTNVVVGSRDTTWPDALTPTTVHGRRLLRTLILVGENCLLWYGQTCGWLALSPMPRLEYSIEIESQRVSDVASHALALHSYA
jgi:hypothetical protein